MVSASGRGHRAYEVMTFSSALVAGEVEYASKSAWLLNLISKPTIEKEPSHFNAVRRRRAGADRLSESQGLFPEAHGARKHCRHRWT